MKLPDLFLAQIAPKWVAWGGIVAGGLLAGTGCEASFEPTPVLIGAEVDVAPYGVYYERGGYVGDYWVWHDEHRHEMREARNVHEGRQGRTHAQGRPDAEHHEEHQDSHDEHR